MSVERACRLADRILTEGYVLCPYRGSAIRGRGAWQFGALAPRARSDRDPTEPWWAQAECLVQPSGGTSIRGRVRFLQIQRRILEEALDLVGRATRPVDTLQVDGRLWVSWEESVARAVDFAIDLDADAGGHAERVKAFAFTARADAAWIRRTDGRVAGRAVKESWPTAGRVHLVTMPVRAESPLVRLRIRVENLSLLAGVGAPREVALPAYFVGVHTVVEASGGAFLSLLDPPAWARDAAAECTNMRLWPVLVGEPGDHSTVLGSPVILPDYPAVALEEPGGERDPADADLDLSLSAPPPDVGVPAAPNGGRFEGGASVPWRADGGLFAGAPRRGPATTLRARWAASGRPRGPSR